MESWEVLRPVRWTSWGLKERSCQYSIHGQAERLCDVCHQAPERLLTGLGSVPGQASGLQGGQRPSGMCGRAGQQAKRDSSKAVLFF